MRLLSVVFLSFIISFIYCGELSAREREEEPMFGARRHYGGPPAMQILAGMGDLVGGGLLLGIGSDSLDDRGIVKPAFQSYEAARNKLLEIRMAFLRDSRLNRMREIHRLLAQLHPFTRDVKSCEAQVAGLTQELEQLALAPAGTGENKTEDQWYLEIEAAEEVLKKELKNYRIKSGVAYFFITSGGFLIAQLGARIWVYNNHELDPGLAPNAVIGYRYGVKPVFRLLGVVDQVEGLFTGAEPERQDSGKAE